MFWVWVTTKQTKETKRGKKKVEESLTLSPAPQNWTWLQYSSRRTSLHFTDEYLFFFLSEWAQKLAPAELFNSASSCFQICPPQSLVCSVMLSLSTLRGVTQRSHFPFWARPGCIKEAGRSWEATAEPSLSRGDDRQRTHQHKDFNSSQVCYVYIFHTLCYSY